LEIPLSAGGGTAAVYGQREHRRDHEGHDADHRGQLVVLLAGGDPVQPGDKQIRPPRLIEFARHRPAAGEQPDDVEVVDVADELRDEIGRCHEQHVGQGDLAELHRRGRAVDP